MHRLRLMHVTLEAGSGLGDDRSLLIMTDLV
jgi:hypothetical protein